MTAGSERMRFRGDTVHVAAVQFAHPEATEAFANGSYVWAPETAALKPSSR